MGHVKCDYIKRLITLTSDNIKRLSLYLNLLSKTIQNEHWNKTSNPALVFKLWENPETLKNMLKQNFTKLYNTI